jgi:hypothetical protein
MLLVFWIAPHEHGASSTITPQREVTLAEISFEKRRRLLGGPCGVNDRTSQKQEKETPMTTITIGKRLIPLEQIALVEPFVPTGNERMQTEKPFKTRIVLLNRDSVLTEEALDAFADQNSFRLLHEDGVATNPAVLFNVEAFEAAGNFKPTKAYRSRLLWRDQSGKVQSKLLLTTPEDILAIAVRGTEGVAVTGRAFSRARRSRKRAGSPTPA